MKKRAPTGGGRMRGEGGGGRGVFLSLVSFCQGMFYINAPFLPGPREPHALTAENSPRERRSGVAAADFLTARRRVLTRSGESLKRLFCILLGNQNGGRIKWTLIILAYGGWLLAMGPIYLRELNVHINTENTPEDG